jgi:hypothetical protein
MRLGRCSGICGSVVAAGISMLAATTAIAELSGAQLKQLADLPLTLQLERDLAFAIRSLKPGTADALRVNLLKAEPELVAELFALGLAASQPSSNAVNASKLRSVALKLGPCHYAGILVRALTIGIANGSFEPVVKDFGIVTKPAAHDLTASFAENAHRCEVIHRLAKSERAIGSTCSIDGRNCDDD